jgi:hypothetical protein
MPSFVLAECFLLEVAPTSSNARISGKQNAVGITCSDLRFTTGFSVSEDNVLTSPVCWALSLVWSPRRFGSWIFSFQDISCRLTQNNRLLSDCCNSVQNLFSSLLFSRCLSLKYIIDYFAFLYVAATRRNNGWLMLEKSWIWQGQFVDDTGKKWQFNRENFTLRSFVMFDFHQTVLRLN